MMKLRVFMKIFSSTFQTKNCVIRSNDVCDDDDNLATMLNSNCDFYVFIKEITFIVVI